MELGTPALSTSPCPKQAASIVLGSFPSAPAFPRQPIQQQELESEDPSLTPPAVSKADCYVELRLPTASPSPAQTRMVANCSDPEWNETFHYQIHGAVKVRASRGRGLPMFLPCIRLPPLACPVSRMSWSSPSVIRTSWAVTSSPCYSLT